MPEQDQYRRMEGEEDQTMKAKMKRGGKWCGKVLGLIILCWAVLAIVIQGALYEYATMSCKPGKLVDYAYPGGGEKDLVPGNTLLIEQEPRMFSSSLIVQPADEAGLALGASTGVYYRTWGPLWWTYVYQDDLAMQTFVVRDRPLALGGSHKIYRCDGTGPTYVVTEGSHVVMNRIRSLFGMYTSRIYNIFEDGKLVALSEKIGGVGQSHKQMIFRDPNKANPFASSFLADRHYHGNFDKWFVHDEANIELPAFVPNAVTMLMAFPTAAAKEAKAKQEKADEDAEAAKKPPGLVELPPSVAEVAAAAPTGLTVLPPATEEGAAATAKVVEEAEETPAAEEAPEGQVGARVAEAEVVSLEQHV